MEHRALDPTVCVVGGGVSGLATAWYLTSRTPARVVLLEGGTALGGKVRTEWVDGLPLEVGPDGFLAEPAALALCEELGLGSQLVGSRTSEAFLWEDEGLRPLRAEDAPRGTGAPPRLTAVRGGLARLVEELAARLRAVDVRRRTAVTGIERGPDGRLLVRLAAGPPIPADQVVLAVPAPAAARLLSGLVPAAAAALAGVAYLDMAVINLVYRGRPWRLRGSGFLAAERPGRLISGCTWLSAKWPHLAASHATAVRVTVGGRGGSDWRSLPDARLVARAHRELASVLGPSPEPGHARVVRWTPALADPRRLDPELVRGAQAAARDSGVVLAAGGYLGGGLASCIADAAAAAAAVAPAMRPALTI